MRQGRARVVAPDARRADQRGTSMAWAAAHRKSLGYQVRRPALARSAVLRLVRTQQLPPVRRQHKRASLDLVRLVRYNFKKNHSRSLVFHHATSLSTSLNERDRIWQHTLRAGGFRGQYAPY